MAICKDFKTLSADIAARIEAIDQQIVDLTSKIEELRTEKKTLEKDIKIAQEREEAKKKMIEEIVDLL